jgi:hypothetical protein
VGKTMQMMRYTTIGKGTGVSPDYGEHSNEFCGEVNRAQVDLEIVIRVDGR